MFYRFLFTGMLLTTLITDSHADEIPPEELERWFNSDSFEPPRYQDVNEGQLVFLATAPEKIPHHHHNSLTIYPHSLADGWVGLEQCHYNMDKVPLAQIVFRPERIRDISITHKQNIEKAWVEGPSVQMENVQAGARLCLRAFTRSLARNADGSYTLTNGPYMRKFLDGFYPLRVSIDIFHADTSLQLVRHTPTEQDGLKVERKDHSLHIDTVFEGQLVTEFHFTTRQP